MKKFLLVLGALTFLACDGEVSLSEDSCEAAVASTDVGGEGGSGGVGLAIGRDDDGDGHALIGTGPGADDCDDNDPAVHPAAEEFCGEYVDQDCDTEIDEGCYSFCDPVHGDFPNPESDVYSWHAHCCEENGIFVLTTSLTVGDLIMDQGDRQIYYIGSDRKRYAFPHADLEFVSWYGIRDSDGVPKADPAICGRIRVLDDLLVPNIPLGGSVPIRPGTYLTGVLSFPGRFVATKNRTLRQLEDAAVMNQLFGGTRWKRVKVLPDEVFENYLIGAEILQASDYDVNSELAVTIEQAIGIMP